MTCQIFVKGYEHAGVSPTTFSQLSDLVFEKSKSLIAEPDVQSVGYLLSDVGKYGCQENIDVGHEFSDLRLILQLDHNVDLNKYLISSSTLGEIFQFLRPLYSTPYAKQISLIYLEEN